MKIQILFDIIRSSQDLLSAFEGVESPAQLVSRLEKLKRSDVEGLLADVENLRDSVDECLSDTIETGGSLAGDLSDASEELDGALSAFPELEEPDEGSSQDATGNNPPVTQDVKKENTTS
jgi:hypothetical protein